MKLVINNTERFSNVCSLLQKQDRNVYFSNYILISYIEFREISYKRYQFYLI